MARSRTNGKRTKSGRLSRAKDELAKRNPPADHIVARRNLFAFVTPTKGPDGRVGEIDQDICDAIGQFHALGLLDGHGADPTELRDKGRFWGHHYAKLLKASGFKTASYERMDKGRNEARVSGTDIMFDRMDEALGSFERSALLSLIVDPIVGSWPLGEEFAPWARSLIGEALLKRGKVPPLIRFPDANDRALLEACVRGLRALVDGSSQRNLLAA